MPNIASILKDEISRIARKEVRAETPMMAGMPEPVRKSLACSAAGDYPGK
ncbi:hypothetical protein ACSFBF_06070 [Variovorax sp. ZT5P49]